MSYEEISQELGISIKYSQELNEQSIKINASLFQVHDEII